MAGTIIVIGGGASGVLAAAQLVLRGAAVTLLEPAAELGRGMAYSTRCPLHLLNVRAVNMSALPDDEGHFLCWLERTRPGQYDFCSFAPRAVYGEYIREVLGEALRVGRGQFQHVRTRATGVRVAAGKIAVETESGSVLHGGAAILATGNAAPAAWPGLGAEVALSGRFFEIAWMEGAFEMRDRHAPVLLLGSGLTAVDALLALRHNGHRGKVYMVSRRGLLPQPHVLPVYGCIRGPQCNGLRGLLRDMRTAASRAAALPAGWREAVDSIRPETNQCWQALSFAEQRSFLRHLRPFWDTHRHRMAPQIGMAVEGSLRDGSLEVLAGRTRGFRLTVDGVEVNIALRGCAGAKTLKVERIVNCTGPDTDLGRSTNPVLRNLVEQGWLQPDPHRLGALADDQGALLPAGVGWRPPLYALGPLRLGQLIESVAIPEIRVQAQELAELLMPGGAE
ncbi:MAG: FAD/NAD(P)-binding protein [Bryobacteraceae bacterium]|jgi:uncharacterized NAD(P)/FAD-binding protein YdhS